MLRWADNPRNTLAAFRALQLLPGMGPANARAAIEHLEAGGHSFEALKTFKPPQTGDVDWQRLIALLLALAEPQRPWPGQVQHGARVVPAALRAPLRALPHAPRGSGAARAALRPVPLARALPHRAHARSAQRHQRPLRHARRSTRTTWCSRPIHSAKGMEWDTVYVLNVVDGSFPSEFSTGKPELIEEERRLLYVAMTRAQNDLLLMAPLKFHLTQPVAPGRCARLRRPQPLRDREGAEDARRGDLPQLRLRRRGQAAGSEHTRHRGCRRPPARHVVGTSVAAAARLLRRLHELQGEAIALADRGVLVVVLGAEAIARRQRPHALLVVLGVLRVVVDL